MPIFVGLSDHEVCDDYNTCPFAESYGLSFFFFFAILGPSKGTNAPKRKKIIEANYEAAECRKSETYTGVQKVRL